MDLINDQMRAHFKHCNVVAELINNKLKEALGPPGSPADLEDLDYIARRVGEVYRAEIKNVLEYKRVVMDEEFERLVRLARESSLDLVGSIEQGQEKLKRELSSLGDSLSSYTFISIGDIGGKAPYSKLTDEYKRLAKKFGWTPKA